jgi:hypothetical protein
MAKEESTQKSAREDKWRNQNRALFPSQNFQHGKTHQSRGQPSHSSIRRPPTQRSIRRLPLTTNTAHTSRPSKSSPLLIDPLKIIHRTLSQSTLLNNRSNSIMIRYLSSARSVMHRFNRSHTFQQTRGGRSSKSGSSWSWSWIGYGGLAGSRA